MKNLKSVWVLALALLLVFSLAACASKPAGDAEETAKDAVFESDGMKLTVPAEFADLVTVDTDMDGDGIFSVSENASVEAARNASEGDEMGAGWLFAIAKVDEAGMHELRTSDNPGATLFARDNEGNYYCLYHPTDMRLFRDGEISEADMHQWETLNEWANGVPETFMAENEGLEPFRISSTQLDSYLTRVAYLDDVSYTISATASGEQQPGNVDKTPYVNKLLDGTIFELYENGGAPDGEYIVLNLPDDGAHIDFFLAEPNTIRVVHGDFEEYYVARFADKTIKAANVMQSWYDALVAANQ